MHLQTYSIGHFSIQDHQLEVPLDWDKPTSSPRIKLFYREVCRHHLRHENLPLLVYLQGGPGGQSPRPSETGPAWLNEASKHYRIILPDQRGTGRSSPIEACHMQLFATPSAAADYLQHYNTHAIIKDFEYLRQTDYHDAKWTSLGQSYGGFLSLNYLSYAPQGLNGCLITGGLPAIHADADEVYAATYARVAQKWQAHTRRFPEDQAIFNHIADLLSQHPVRLPNGDMFTVARLQYLGFMLGMSDGSTRLHWLLEQAFATPEKATLSHPFLFQVMAITSMDEAPLFAAIHEHIYANTDKACDFAAERLRPATFNPEARPLYPTGEMIYPWMFNEISHLCPYREAVHALAERTLIKPYYDAKQLADNQVPVAAAIYADDMYVESRLSLATAHHINRLAYWLTNEYEHDGLRQDVRVFTRLLEILERL